MPQALAKVKSALGADAVIMDTRSVRKAGALGLGSRECVQVWAAQAPDAVAPRSTLLIMPAAGANGGMGTVAASQLDTGLLTALHARLGDLEAKLDLLSMAAAYGNGSRAEVHPVLAELDEHERAAARAGLARRIPLSGEIAIGSARVVALVGPTGAGKTMTAAKLAGRLGLMHGARVGIICADGYKVAAMGEMAAYCDLLGVPMACAHDVTELRAALDALADCALVLVDTAGASQRNAQYLTELRDLLQAVGADEAHLVLSAAASSGACAEAIARFAAIGATHLVFAKLDESPDPGEALSTAVGAGLPVSYLADGQAVPQDIRPADEDVVAAAYQLREAALGAAPERGAAASRLRK